MHWVYIVLIHLLSRATKCQSSNSMFNFTYPLNLQIQFLLPFSPTLLQRFSAARDRSCPWNGPTPPPIGRWPAPGGSFRIVPPRSAICHDGDDGTGKCHRPVNCSCQDVVATTVATARTLPMNTRSNRIRCRKKRTSDVIVVDWINFFSPIASLRMLPSTQHTTKPKKLQQQPQMVSSDLGSCFSTSSAEESCYIRFSLVPNKTFLRDLLYRGIYFVCWSVGEERGNDFGAWWKVEPYRKRKKSHEKDNCSFRDTGQRCWVWYTYL